MKDAKGNDASSPGPESTGPGSALSDAEAVEAVLAGDTEAFAAIVRRHEGEVFARAYRMLRDADDAADVVQEAFVRAYTKLGGYNPRRPFKPWLLRIATNAAITHRRKARRQIPDALSEQLADSAPSPRHRAEVAELEKQLDTAVDQLPPNARELFELRYRRELSAKEIAEITGRKPNAVIVALHRMRLRLRAMVFGNST